MDTGGGFGSALIDTTVVDDDWSGGYVGVFRNNTVTAAAQYNNFRFGIDNNADGDIDDAGDDVLVSDSFDSNITTLTWDNNGNCTFDGVWTYTYDACPLAHASTRKRSLAAPASPLSNRRRRDELGNE